MDWAGWDKEISAEKELAGGPRPYGKLGGARKIAIVLIIHSVDSLLQTSHRDFYQVTLDIALRWSAGIWIYRILSTYRSSGSKT